jgi:hypothetical protein
VVRGPVPSREVARSRPRGSPRMERARAERASRRHGLFGAIDGLARVAAARVGHADPDRALRLVRCRAGAARAAPRS